MFCYFNYGDFGETAAFIEDKTHIKLICEPEIEFYSLNPEIFHFSICSLFREKLMDLLNEFTYLELTSIQPFLKGNDRSELIGLIDLAINGYRKLKASVYLSEDDDFLDDKNQSSKNSKELVEDLDLHFLMDIKEVLTKHLLDDIELKINWGQRMLYEIRQALALELDKNQDINVI